jgi:thioredoxin reductase
MLDTGRCDVAIVGCGAAGQNAALILGRARRLVLVFDAGKPRNAPAAIMHGFLSRDHCPPKHLLEIGRVDLHRYPSATIIHEEIVDVRPQGTGFAVSSERGRMWHARRVLFATGVKDQLPPIEGLAELWGRSVFVCPYCDGWEVKDQRLAISGSPETLISLAQELYGWSHDILLCGYHEDVVTEDGRRWLEAATGVTVTPQHIRSLVNTDGRLTALQLRDGTSVERDVVFLIAALRQRSDLPERLGCELTYDGRIKVDEHHRTSVPGCFAAGDATSKIHQVIVAAASGVQAAIAMNSELVEEDARAMAHPVQVDARPGRP